LAGAVVKPLAAEGTSGERSGTEDANAGGSLVLRAGMVNHSKTKYKRLIFSPAWCEFVRELGFLFWLFEKGNQEGNQVIGLC